MKVKIHQLALLFAALSFVFILGACNKKVAHATPPPPPPTAPTAALSVQPTVVQKGQYVTLSWKTDNANEVTLTGIGAVNSSGTDRVMPQESTTYTLDAKGPGGERDASARVTVNVPVAAQVPSPTLDELFAKNIKDVFFDFDKYTIRPDQQTTLQADANFLQSQPVKVTLEGHCDDRGSEEYNLALGVSRAEAMKSALVKAGVPANRLATISYGKEKPFCSADNDQCWQSNRRDHVVRAQ